jgi:energy-coupling factor transporter ATP-binding protein EcfA2
MNPMTVPSLFPQPNTTPSNPGYPIAPTVQRLLSINDYQALANWMTHRVLRVLTTRQQHHNIDGSWYMPRIASVQVFAPIYVLISIDTEALWHFTREQFTNAAMLDALSSAVRRPVRVYPASPQGDLIYIITLADLPKESEALPSEADRLPISARLDLGSANIEKDKLLVPIGASAKGAVVMALPKLGHALITGTTGSGKSTWVHAALATLLTQNSPKDLSVALVDPKRNELTLWSQVPHLFGYACESQDAENLLAALVEEMNRRGELFGRKLCRDIQGYNTRVETNEQLPYVLIVIDECLDLVMSGTRRLNELLKTISIRGRSAGIILWAATQHASALDGLPRVVATNLTSRLVFRVADANAARTAGCPGAQMIPRTIPGRMLAKTDGEPRALQSYFLSDEELLQVSGQWTVGSGQGELSLKATPLSESDRTLLAWAIEQGGGYLSVGDIMRVGGVGQQEARRIADRFEQVGWIEKDPNNKNKRRVCQRVADQLGGVSTEIPDKLTSSTNSTN